MVFIIISSKFIPSYIMTTRVIKYCIKKSYIFLSNLGFFRVLCNLERVGSFYLR